MFEARPIKTNRACFVGSGECKNPATHEIDTCDDEIPIAYVCVHHLEEMEAFEEMLKTLPQEKIDRLTAEVRKAHDEMRRQRDKGE